MKTIVVSNSLNEINHSHRSQSDSDGGEKDSSNLNNAIDETFGRRTSNKDSNYEIGSNKNLGRKFSTSSMKKNQLFAAEKLGDPV